MDAGLCQVSSSLYSSGGQTGDLTCHSSDDTLLRLADAVNSLRMKKDMIGWDLEGLEALTFEGGERESDSDDESEDEIERMLPAPLS